MELKMQPKVYANSRSRGVPAPAPNTQHPQELQPKVRNHKDGTLTFKASSIRTLCMLNGGLNMVTDCEIFANLHLEL